MMIPMSWSFRILRVAGIDVKVHVTFLLLLAFFAVIYYSQGGAPAAAEGVLFILLLFACVLLHEFGHALAAKGYGIRTPDITLLPIGGVARLERMPDKPFQELVVALAGPLVNVVIVSGLFLVMGGRGDFARLTQLQAADVDLVMKMFSINILLVVFNMIPAFPMDGGRVLRALLATRMNYARATQVAASIGQGFAVVFGLVGLFHNPFLIFIAVFVWLGASQEAAVAQMRDVSSGLPVASAMVTEFETLPHNATLDDAVEALLRTSQHDFPVMGLSDNVLGILTRKALIEALRSHGGSARAADFIQRDVPTVHALSSFDAAFQLMQQCACPALPVLDSEGRLVGLITPENIGEMMMIHAARGARTTPSWRRRNGVR